MEKDMIMMKERQRFSLLIMKIMKKKIKKTKIFKIIIRSSETTNTKNMNRKINNSCRNVLEKIILLLLVTGILNKITTTIIIINTLNKMI